MKKFNGQVIMFALVILITLGLAMFGRPILVLFNLSDSIIENTVGDYVSGLIGAVIGAMLAVVSSGIVIDHESKRKESFECKVLASIILNDINENIKNFKNKSLWTVLEQDKRYQIWLPDAKKYLQDTNDVVLSPSERIEKIIQLSQLADDKDFTESDMQNLLEVYRRMDCKLYIGHANELVRCQTLDIVQKITKLYESIDRYSMDIQKTSKLMEYFDYKNKNYNWDLIIISKIISRELMPRNYKRCDERKNITFEEYIENIEEYKQNIPIIRGVYEESFPFSMPKDTNDVQEGIVNRIIYNIYHLDDAFPPPSPFSTYIPSNLKLDKQFGKNLKSKLDDNIQTALHDKLFVWKRYRKNPHYDCYRMDWEIVCPILKEICNLSNSSNFTSYESNPFSDSLPKKEFFYKKEFEEYFYEENADKTKYTDSFPILLYERFRFRNLCIITLWLLWYRQRNNKEINEKLDHISFGSNPFAQKIWDSIQSVVNELKNIPVSTFMKVPENAINEFAKLTKEDCPYYFNGFGSIITPIISKAKDLLEKLKCDDIMNCFDLGYFLHNYGIKASEHTSVSTIFSIPEESCLTDFFDCWQIFFDKLNIVSKDEQKYLDKYEEFDFNGFSMESLYNNAFDQTLCEYTHVYIGYIFCFILKEPYDKLKKILLELINLRNPVIYQACLQRINEHVLRELNSLGKCSIFLHSLVTGLANDLFNLIYIEIPNLKNFIMDNDISYFEKIFLTDEISSESDTANIKNIQKTLDKLANLGLSNGKN